MKPERAGEVEEKTLPGKSTIKLDTERRVEFVRALAEMLADAVLGAAKPQEPCSAETKTPTRD